MPREHPVFTQQLLKKVETAVESAESGSGAEIVVVLARESGPYRDVSLTGGALTAWIALGAILHSSWNFHVDLVLIYVTLAFAFGTLITGRVCPLKRLLSRQRRRSQQVMERAKLCFHEETISGTRDRTGLLLYYSRFERELVLLPDLGVLTHVPMARFHEATQQFRKRSVSGSLEEALVDTIESLGPCLEKACPRREDDTNELHNRPRVIL